MSFPRIRSAFHIAKSARTMVTLSDIPVMTAGALSQKILEEREVKESTLAIIDVRDDDYIGGHIKGSSNIPSNQLEAMMPTLVRRLQAKKTVVFHCMLSQQRGPRAALQYLRERDGVLKTLGGDVAAVQDQRVVILQNGWDGWRQLYAEDERLTEGYRKDLWED